MMISGSNCATGSEYGTNSFQPCSCSAEDFLMTRLCTNCLRKDCHLKISKVGSADYGRYQRLKDLHKTNYHDIPLERLQKAVQTANRIEKEIDKRRQKLADVLTHISNRYHLSRKEKWLLVDCLQVSTSVNEALSRTLSRIFEDLAQEKVSRITNDRGYRRISARATAVDALVADLNATLNIYGDWDDLDQLIEFERQKANAVFSELASLRLCNNGGTASLRHVS
jgi:hypothetical protein